MRVIFDKALPDYSERLARRTSTRSDRLVAASLDIRAIHIHTEHNCIRSSVSETVWPKGVQNCKSYERKGMTADRINDYRGVIQIYGSL